MGKGKDEAEVEEKKIRWLRGNNYEWLKKITWVREKEIKRVKQKMVWICDKKKKICLSLRKENQVWKFEKGSSV